MKEKINYRRLTDKQVQSLIGYINNNVNYFDIFGVDVHGVGFEYRIRRRLHDEKEKINFISIEDILGRNFSLDINIFSNFHYKLSKSQYDLLDKFLEPLWIKQGRRYENRGLY